MNKRQNYISWEEYFMGIAQLSAQRSKDPNTQVGACIVNTENKIVAIGYNGLPVGCADEDFSWGRCQEQWLDNKYPYVVHAEANAILNSTTKLNGCCIYVTEFPCNECAKLIIQSGIKEVIYLSDKYDNSDITIASKKMLDYVNINYRKYGG